MTTVASSAPTSPADSLSERGINARIVVNAVIRMGRTRVRPADITASSGSRPARRCW